MNILGGIFENKTFILIVFSIFALQIILITFTGSAFHVYSDYGLVPRQWFLCIAIGFLSVPLNFLLKFIQLEEPEATEDQVDEAMEPTQQAITGGSNMIKIKSKDEKVLDAKIFNVIQSPNMLRNPDEIGFMWPKYSIYFYDYIIIFLTYCLNNPNCNYRVCSTLPNIATSTTTIATSTSCDYNKLI